MGNARVAAFVSGRAVGGRSLRRQTAAEVIKSHENWGGLNLKEEELAADLVRRIRAGGYAFVSSVFDELASHDRDDVAQSMVELLSFAHHAPWGATFHASLPLEGESGTLRHRARYTPARGNLHAKTGTTNTVRFAACTPALTRIG